MKKLNSLIVLMFLLTSVFSKPITTKGNVSDSLPPDSVPVSQVKCRAAFYINQFNLKDSLTQNSVPNTFTFVNVSTGNGLSYSWDFGDNTASVDPSPLHTYNNSGNYSVCLTISAGNACNDKICQNISVNTNNTTFNIDPLTPDSLINNNKTWTANVDSLIAPPVDTCAIDYSKPIESAIIDSIHVIDQNNVNVDWIIKQYVDSIHINTTYNFNTPGTNMFYLTVQCNSNTKSAGHSNTFVDQYNVPVPTGISNVQKNVSVSTYPNPVIDRLNINLTSVSKEKVQLMILNQLGQSVYSSNELKESGNSLISINTAPLSEGLYFIRIQTGSNGSYTSKFTKIKN